MSEQGAAAMEKKATAKCYGLFQMTKKTYLILQSIVLATIILSFVILFSVKSLISPEAYNFVFWICIIGIAAEAIESVVMLSRFSAAEKKMREEARGGAGR